MDTLNLPIKTIQPTELVVKFFPDREPDVFLGGTPAPNVHEYFLAVLDKFIQSVSEEAVALSGKYLLPRQECEWRVHFGETEIISSGKAPAISVATLCAAWIEYYEQQQAKHPAATA